MGFMHWFHTVQNRMKDCSRGIGLPNGGGQTLLEGRNVGLDEVRRAQESLRVLRVERDALSYIIQRLYEAEANGKINKEELNHLMHRYGERMIDVRNAITRSRSMVTLHQLEEMQGELIKLFNKHFHDINKEIEELRARLKVKPPKEMPIPTPTSSPPAAPKGQRKGKEAGEGRLQRSPQKMPEGRVEKIREDVERALERLEQIEAKA